jgi:hypothetical protein
VGGSCYYSVPKDEAKRQLKNSLMQYPGYTPEQMELIENDSKTSGCIDSDSGKDYNSAGLVVAKRDDTGSAIIDISRDYCETDNRTISESYCEGSKIETEFIVCPNGCMKDACV